MISINKKMNFGLNSFNDSFKINNFLARASTGSYRIIHITKKSPDESDDEQNPSSKFPQNAEIRIKFQKKSFKLSNRNGLDGWKRRSTKKRSFLFHDKSSRESTMKDSKMRSSTNSKSDRTLQIPDRSDSENFDETTGQNDATLDDLLARANQLENTFTKKEFHRIQPLSRGHINRRRQRFFLACCTLLITMLLILTVLVIVVIQTSRSKKSSIESTSSINDV